MVKSLDPPFFDESGINSGERFVLFFLALRVALAVPVCPLEVWIFGGSCFLGAFLATLFSSEATYLAYFLPFSLHFLRLQKNFLSSLSLYSSSSSCILQIRNIILKINRTPQHPKHKKVTKWSEILAGVPSDRLEVKDGRFLALGYTKDRLDQQADEIELSARPFFFWSNDGIIHGKECHQNYKARASMYPQILHLAYLKQAERR